MTRQDNKREGKTRQDLKKKPPPPPPRQHKTIQTDKNRKSPSKLLPLQIEEKLDAEL